MAAPGRDQVSVVADGFGIEVELEQRVKAQAAKFETSYKRTVEEAWKLGRELREAKSQVRHGQWIPWLENRVGLTPRSAQRLMALHEAYPQMRHVSHLRSVSRALKVLPSGPKPEVPAASEAASGLGAVAGSGGTSPLGGQRAVDSGGDRVAAAVRELSRVVERLEPILHDEPGISAARQPLPVLCEALQTIISAMIGWAEIATDNQPGPAKELVRSLEAALAKAREVRGSMLVEREAQPPLD